jgi:hypothetical protein
MWIIIPGGGKRGMGRWGAGEAGETGEQGGEIFSNDARYIHITTDR